MDVPGERLGLLHGCKVTSLRIKRSGAIYIFWQRTLRTFAWYLYQVKLTDVAAHARGLGTSSLAKLEKAVGFLMRYVTFELVTRAGPSTGGAKFTHFGSVALAFVFRGCSPGFS